MYVLAGEINPMSFVEDLQAKHRERMNRLHPVPVRGPVIIQHGIPKDEHYKTIGKLQAKIDELAEKVDRQQTLINAANLVESKPGGKFRATCKLVRTVVSDHYKISLGDLDSRRRTKTMRTPRQVMFYLCRRMTLASLPEIGRRCGYRDHTTVLHSVRKIEGDRLSDTALDAELTILERRIGAEVA